MSVTLSVRLDPAIKKRLETLASGRKRSKSVLAAEAIAAYVDAEEWQLREIRKGIKDLSGGHTASHAKVSRWLRSWGKTNRTRG